LQPYKINPQKTRPIPIVKIEKPIMKASNWITVKNHILSLPTNNPTRLSFTTVILMQYHPTSPSAKVIPSSRNKIAEATAKTVLKIVRAIRFKNRRKRKRKSLKF
jgi:hypothetical protein